MRNQMFLLAGILCLTVAQANAGVELTCFPNLKGNPCTIKGFKQQWQGSTNLDRELVQNNEGLNVAAVSSMLLQILKAQASKYKASGWSDQIINEDGDTLTRRFAYDKFGFTGDCQTTHPKTSVDQFVQTWDQILKNDFVSKTDGKSPEAHSYYWPALTNLQIRASLLGKKTRIPLIVTGQYTRVKSNQSSHHNSPEYKWIKTPNTYSDIYVVAGYDLDGNLLLADPKVSTQKSDLSHLLKAKLNSTQFYKGQSPITEVISPQEKPSADHKAFIESLVWLEL